MASSYYSSYQRKIFQTPPPETSSRIQAATPIEFRGMIFWTYRKCDFQKLPGLAATHHDPIMITRSLMKNLTFWQKCGFWVGWEMLDFHDWKSQQSSEKTWVDSGRTGRIKCKKNVKYYNSWVSPLETNARPIGCIFPQKGQRELQNAGKPVCIYNTNHTPTNPVGLFTWKHPLRVSTFGKFRWKFERNTPRSTGPWNLPRGHLYDTAPLVVEPTQWKNMRKSNWIICPRGSLFLLVFQGLLYDTNPNFMHHCTGKCLKTTIIYLHCFSHVFPSFQKMGPISWPPDTSHGKVAPSLWHFMGLAQGEVTTPSGILRKEFFCSPGKT